MPSYLNRRAAGVERRLRHLEDAHHAQPVTAVSDRRTPRLDAVEERLGNRAQRFPASAILNGLAFSGRNEARSISVRSGIVEPQLLLRDIVEDGHPLLTNDRQ